MLILDDAFTGKISPDILRIFLMVLNRRGGRPFAMSMNPDPRAGRLLDLLYKEALRFAQPRLARVRGVGGAGVQGGNA